MDLLGHGDSHLGPLKSPCLLDGGTRLTVDVLRRLGWETGGGAGSLLSASGVLVGRQWCPAQRGEGERRHGKEGDGKRRSSSPSPSDLDR